MPAKKKAARRSAKVTPKKADPFFTSRRSAKKKGTKKQPSASGTKEISTAEPDSGWRPVGLRSLRKPECEKCEGLGYLETSATVKCPRCKGVGWIEKDDGREVICPKCDGLRTTTRITRRECRKCDGKGHLVEIVQSFVKEEECTSCSGSGKRLAYTYMENCPECKGSGYSSKLSESEPEQLASEQDGLNSKALAKARVSPGRKLHDPAPGFAWVQYEILSGLVRFQRYPQCPRCQGKCAITKQQMTRCDTCSGKGTVTKTAKRVV